MLGCLLGLNLPKSMFLDSDSNSDRWIWNPRCSQVDYSWCFTKSMWDSFRAQMAPGQCFLDLDVERFGIPQVGIRSTCTFTHTAVEFDSLLHVSRRKLVVGKGFLDLMVFIFRVHLRVLFLGRRLVATFPSQGKPFGQATSTGRCKRKPILDLIVLGYSIFGSKSSLKLPRFG